RQPAAAARCPLGAGRGPPPPPPAAAALRRSRRWVWPAAIAAAFALAAAGISGARHREAAPPTFVQKTFGDQTIFNARYAPDGKTIVFSAARYGKVPDLFVLRPEFADPRPLGLTATHLLSVSSKGELAVLTKARLAGIRLFSGTLARVALGSDRPREIMDEVREADWGPDGVGLAVVRQIEGHDQIEYPIGTKLYESRVGYLSDPRVSPRGDRAAFFEHPHPWFDDGGKVCVVDRGGRVSLLGEFYSVEGLAWSP